MKPSIVKIFECCKTILCAVVIALLFRSFVFEAYKIPSSSMTPTLMIGDYLFVSKYKYGYSKHSFPITIDFIEGRFFYSTPVRGDIIVFKSPRADENKYYIKRLVGLPGDKIQVRYGILYINGTAVPRKKIGTYTALYKDEPQGTYDCYEEVLPNGIKYNVLDANFNSHNEFPDQTAIFTVPQGYYFMMGDHRNRSVDSRYTDNIGFISADRLIGRAEVLFWTRDFSFWEMITKLKFNRLFNKLFYEPTVSIL